MAITASEMKQFKSAVIGDGSTNGGIMVGVEVVSNSPNNTWPNVLKDERDAGSSLKRKQFGKPNSDNEDSLVGSRIYNFAPTPGDDYIVMYKGTQTDTEADMSTTDAYGVAALATGVSATDTTLIVTVEDSSIAADIFKDGYLIVVNSKLTPDAVSGTKEFATISGTPVVAGSQVTITIAAGLSNDFAAGVNVCSIIEYGTTTATLDNIVVTSSGGTFNTTTFPPVMNNKGTKEEEITITFGSGGTTFTVVSSVDGALASGTTASDYAPTNAVFSVERFTLLTGIFSGFAENDTVVFETHPNNAPYWMDRIVPAGSDSLSTNLNITVYEGESA